MVLNLDNRVPNSFVLNQCSVDLILTSQNVCHFQAVDYVFFFFFFFFFFFLCFAIFYHYLVGTKLLKLVQSYCIKMSIIITYDVI